jgi:hypothetical protein
MTDTYRVECDKCGLVRDAREIEHDGVVVYTRCECGSRGGRAIL